MANLLGKKMTYNRTKISSSSFFIPFSAEVSSPLSLYNECHMDVGHSEGISAISVYGDSLVFPSAECLSQS